MAHFGVDSGGVSTLRITGDRSSPSTRLCTDGGKAEEARQVLPLTAIDQRHSMVAECHSAPGIYTVVERPIPHNLRMQDGEAP